MAIIGQTFDGKRRWVYAGRVTGHYQRLHRASGAVLMAIGLVTPWLTVAGRPLLLLDMEARRLVAFGGVFTPQDSIFLVVLILFATFALFLFTSLFGRIWCGYACPQTVFMEELIRPIETFIEGSRGKRMARAKKGWTAERVARRAAAWTAYAAVAALVAMSVTSYLVPARVLWTGGASTFAYTGVAALAGLLWVDFAWFREQFCNYLCPYARFQGALTDDNSLTVAYDVALAEPRKGQAPTGEQGACIDCNLCVAVCPQGIDIRDGYQLECINCGRCVDACTGVMDRVGQPQSLIRYTPIAVEEGRSIAWLRPRTVAYGAVLSGLLATFIVLLGSHQTLEATVNRMPGTLFTVDADGWLRNTYMLSVTNLDGHAEGPAQVAVSIDGLEGAVAAAPPIELALSQSTQVPLAVRVPPGSPLGRTTAFDVVVESGVSRLRVPATFKTAASVGSEP